LQLPFDSHPEFEFSPPTRHIAELSSEHREWGAQVAQGLARLVERLADDKERESRLPQIAVTSDTATIAAVDAMARAVAAEIIAAKDHERFNEELFADALGLASWAVGAEPQGEGLTIERINLLCDARVRLLMRVAAAFFIAVYPG